MPVQELDMVTGYGEWANRIISLQNGCSYDGYGDPEAGGCRYCWARASACRFGRHTPETWTTPKGIDWKLVHKTNWGILQGITAYPGTHDISLDLVGPTIQLLANLLIERNRVLLVTKPRYYAVKAICDTFADHPNRDCIEWRFTLTSPRHEDLRYWEPNAPLFSERHDALRYARSAQFAASVNTEPLLCPLSEVPNFAFSLLGFATRPVWLGLINRANRRVVRDPEGRLGKLLEDQSDANVRKLYEALKRCRGIRWKSSIKQIVGLPLNEKPGMDK